MGTRALPKPLRGNLIAPATAVASLVLAAGASAGSGGVGGGGGVDAPEPPKLTDLQCLEQCAGRRRATVGSKVELLGRRLRDTESVGFTAAGADRIEAAPTSTARRSVQVSVPDGAETGRPRVSGPTGADTSPEELTIVAPEDIPAEGDFSLRSADASPATAYYDGMQDPAVTYTFEGAPTDVRVEVVNRETHKVVAGWIQEDRQPFAANEARWDGRKDGGGVAKNGRFRFELGAAGGGTLATTDDARFAYHDHKFPVRGAHSYGDGIGAGRGHQGQDVFAACGSELQAARGGRIQTKQYHGAAGYYLVIDGRGTGRDYAYMHMQRDGRPAEGARVHTGETIGTVGATGNASGCHLHFEIWSAPGWYEGGHFTNPTDDLKEWDRWS